MKSQKGFINILLIIVIAALIAAGGIYVACQKGLLTTILQKAPAVTKEATTTTDTTTMAATSEIGSTSDTGFATLSTEEIKNQNARLKEMEPYKVEVKWKDKLVSEGPECPPEEQTCDEPRYYLAGQIINGALKEQDIYLAVVPTPGGYDMSHYVVIDGRANYLEESDFDIKGITDIPEKIQFSDTKYKMKKSYPNALFADIKLNKKVFTSPKLGAFYSSETGCLVVELPDHTAIAYDLEFPFISRENNELQLTFNNGIKNKDQYSFHVISCGGLCYELTIVDEQELKSGTRLVAAGKTSNGEKFYKIKDKNDQVLKDLFDDENTVAYVRDENTKELIHKYTYEEFLNYKPLLYWKDPLGRWIEFKNERFLFAAEKCKPVIYLYPKTKTALNVQVAPNGGFTKTIPQYPAGGWNVEAYPNGDIIDTSTGQKYDYLYWSGIGLNYPFKKDEGWLVKKESMSSFLDEKLKLLGLNEKEAGDFKEYWVNKLNNMPYYQISFLSRSQIQELSPLQVSPVNPDSVIRVLMTAKGLNEAKTLTPQILPKTPKRNGFAVVEWGGVLIK